MVFPSIFAYVPWGHLVMIMQRSQSIEEALFYVKKTVEGNQIELAEEEYKMNLLNDRS